MPEITTSHVDMDEVISNLSAKAKRLEDENNKYNAALTEAYLVLQKIGARLVRFAEEYEWCKTYDDEILEYDGGSVAAQRFYDAAKRNRTVNKRVELTIQAEFSLDDYDFSELTATETMAESGVYSMPDDFEVNSVDDLEDDQVEHLYDTDLVAWYRKAQYAQATVRVEEDGVEAEEA